MYKISVIWSIRQQNTKQSQEKQLMTQYRKGTREKKHRTGKGYTKGKERSGM